MAKKNWHGRLHIFIAALFCLIALVHLLRLLKGWQLIIGNWSIAMWPSAVAIVLALTLAVLLRVTAE